MVDKTQYLSGKIIRYYAANLPKQTDNKEFREEKEQHFTKAE